MGDIAAKVKQKTSITHTMSTSTEQKSNQEPPKDAKIRSKTIRTETEEIENGWIVSKNYDISWTDSKGNNQYSYYTKKWYSEEQPVEVKVTDKSLAEAFDDES